MTRSLCLLWKRTGQAWPPPCKLSTDRYPGSDITILVGTHARSFCENPRSSLKAECRTTWRRGARADHRRGVQSLHRKRICRDQHARDRDSGEDIEEDALFTFPREACDLG